jgi:hypothetical protein
MCLLSVIGTRVLKSDKRVYKWVNICGGTEMTPYVSYGLNKRINFAIPIELSLFKPRVGDIEGSYISGFHVFGNKKVALKSGWGNNMNYTLRDYVIPKGAEVLLGIEEENDKKDRLVIFKEIVTPVLINPRIAK